MNLISPNQLEKSLNRGLTCYALVFEKPSQRSSCRFQDTFYVPRPWCIPCSCLFLWPCCITAWVA